MMFEPCFNNGYLAYSVRNILQAISLTEAFLTEFYLIQQNGDLQTSYQAFKKSIELFPNHAAAKEMLRDLQEQFSVL